MTESNNNPSEAADSGAVVDSPPKAAPARKKVAAAGGKTAKWLLVSIAMLLILLAILLLIARIGLPLVGNYKGEIETRLSERMGGPVVIDELSMRWERFSPMLSASGVSLSESPDRQVTLDEVLIGLNVLKSISQRTPVIDELTLVGARLALETSADGKFQLHGLKQSQATQASPDQGENILSWIMDTDKVDLQDAQITLINAVDNQQLTITDLNITSINDDDLHQLRADMQLPEALGDHLELDLELVGSSDDIRNAAVDVHLKGTDLKADAWRALQAERLGGLQLSTTGIARLDATTQIELWGTMSAGKLQSARGQILATDLIDINSQQSVIDRISTDIVYKDTPSGWQLSTDLLEFQNGTQLTSVHDVVYQFKPAQNTAWSLDARGDSLKLDVATKLLLSLFAKDADSPRARWLAKASPKGDLTDWNASLALVDGKPDFSVYSAVKGLELTAASVIPGATNIDGVLEVQDKLATIGILGENMELDFPSAYAQPLQLQKLVGQLDVDFQDPLNTSIKGDIAVDDFGFTAKSRVEAVLKSGAAHHIFTKGQFSLDDVSRVSRYTPEKLLKPKLNDWLNSAFVAGQITNGELLMSGDVTDFPFTDNKGVFKVGFDFNDTTLDYLEGWPQGSAMQGRFDGEGATVRITANEGLMESMRFSSVEAQINNLFNPVLELSSTSAGSLAKLIEFGNTGPLKETLGPALSDVTAKGDVQMDLNIGVPLGTGVKAGVSVNGSIFLNNNSVSLDLAKLDLEDVNGAVGFTENGIRANNLQALVNGRPVRIDAKTEGQGLARTAKVTMAGPMQASYVLENYDIPLTRFVDGESHWNVNVNIPMTSTELTRSGIRVAAVSSLVGTQLILPEPMLKATGSSASIALSSTLFPNNTQSEWLIDYGGVMRSIVRVDDDDGLQSLSVRFGGGAPNPDVIDGIRLEGDIAKLALDGWATSIDALLDDLEPDATPKPIIPIWADLKVDKFIAGRQYVGGGTLRFNTDTDYINGVIDSQWLAGSVRYPRVHWKQDRAAVVRVTTADKRFVDALETAPEGDDVGDLDPRELPPIEARIAQVRWDDLDLKDLTIRTSPAVNGLNIDTFGFANQSAQLVGEGYWHLRDSQGVNDTLTDQHISRLNLTLQGYDFGSLLSRVGFDGVLSQGEGVLSASLTWPAAAYRVSLENLIGEMDIDIKNGRILKVEPGAARLVGLFAIQTLPRRLNLDFKDLVLDGLDYETVRGRVQIANGIAHAPLVQLNGPIGVVDLAGESDLITEQYNQSITVLPRVSAALPIIGVISGGASGGLSVLFAGGLLKALGVDFDLIGLRKYTLTGSWEEPKLTPIPF